jgi:WD40 repeat protein/DNA-binding CsgD family transcriptional regulator
MDTAHDLKGYELRERIGTGGFGAVYRAYQTTVGREVAVKIILPGLANQPDFIRRFEGEAQLVARLEHPHIVPLHDYWRDPEGAYLVMRWLRGGSLREALVNGPFELRSAALLLDQLAGALSLAHRNNVIHRDIKPGNILLDEDSNAYLTDFGIAKDLNLAGSGTQPDAIIGSLDYISPEQARSEPVTPRTDIYSLGVTLYEVITGHHPFQNISTVERLYKHINDPLPPITTLDPSVSTEVNRVIQKATAKNPEHRYPDALAFAADFREAVGLNRTPTTVIELLTQREHEILRLIIEGMSNKEIAQQLTVTVGTVKWYVNQIYGKLGVRSRVQAIVRARELNLIGGTVDAANGTFTTSNLPEPENPYKGLRAFQAADEQDFFGREELTQKLVARLGHISASRSQPLPIAMGRGEGEGFDSGRFLAVVGPSGSGKSSVVKAGLIPALWRGDLPGSERSFIAEMLPGAHPLDKLEVALIRVAANQASNLNQQLTRNQRGLLRVADLILPNDSSELVLIIDQFEEVFTLVEDEAERQQFLNLLTTAVNDPRSRVRVVLTLRADFYDRPLNYPEFGDLVRHHMETVMPLSAKELERAINGPAQRSGVRFEDGLVASIVAEMNYQAGALPLLQYALTELFERRVGRLLTHQAYQEIGGAVGALAKRAEELYQELTPEGQEAARQMFLRLVTLGEGVEDTRRRTPRAELLAIANSPSPRVERGSGGEVEDLMDEILDTYAAYRLLTLDNDLATRTPTVELAHEAILREWERLRGWLNESRHEIRLQRQLAAMAADWREASGDRTFLAHGSRLEQFEKWANDTRLALTPEERDYLESSLGEREQQAQAETERQAREQTLERRSVRFLRALVAVLLLATLGAFGLTGLAVNNANEAQINFITSERIRLAAQAQIALDQGEGGDIPALLAIRSLQLGYSPEADAALLNALTRGFPRQRYVGHTSFVETVAFSSDGRTLLTAGTDNTVRLWDVQTGVEQRQFHNTNGLSADLSPDGAYVAVGAYDGTVSLLDVATGQEISQFTENIGVVNWLEFSPDGQYLVTADNEMARLWEVQTGEQVRQFVGHTDKVYMVRLSFDGHYLVTGSLDNTARIWDVTTGIQLQQFAGHTDCVCGIAFSPDGRFIATASLDQTARLWDIASGRELRQFLGHNDAVYDVAFSPDGRYLLTSSLDKTARLWDIASGQEVRSFIGHTASVAEAAFSSDGRYVVTVSADRTARLWDVQLEAEPRVLIADFTGHDSVFYAIQVSPDNRLALTGTGDGRLRQWDLHLGTITSEITLDAGTMNDLAISPDSRYVLTGGADRLVYMWDALTGEAVRQFVGHSAPVWSIVVSSDSRHALTGSEDNTARLWDMQTGQEVRPFTGHTSPVWAVAFSPDNRFVLTGSEDATVWLWDTQTGQEIRQFTGHTGPVRTLAFSPDGQLVLTGGDDRTARLWNVQTGDEIYQFAGHTDQVRAVVFSPDGRYILTGSSDQTARLWDTETGQEVRRLVGHAQPVLFVGFSPDGQYITTGDRRIANIWRTQLDDVIAFACSHLGSDLSNDERALYNITDTTAVCPEFSPDRTAIEPTWTPFVASAASQPTAVPLITEMVFVNEAANIQMGAPIQDVYVENPDGFGVVRPVDLSAETLAQPVYSSTQRVVNDWWELPFDIGPYPQGEPLGFTVADWVAVQGHGTYTLHGARATLDLTFEHLVPNGLYTLWCLETNFAPDFQVHDAPCGTRSGSESVFVADENGRGTIQVEIDAFPPSTNETIYSVAAAYHSDGRTYGPRPGDFGRNVHVQTWFDFLPPNFSPPQ